MRLIDAEKLRAEYLGMPNCYNGFSDTYDKAMIVDIVDEQPTIDAVPVVHGTWVVKGQDIFCSLCGEESSYTWYGGSKFSRYCPNCGAKMDGGKDDDKTI